MNPLRRPVRWLVVVWCASVLVDLAWFLIAAARRPPTEEIYTQLLAFQLAAFAVKHLIWWIGGLFVVLCVAMILFGRAKGFRDP